MYTYLNILWITGYEDVSIDERKVYYWEIDVIMLIINLKTQLSVTTISKSMSKYLAHQSPVVKEISMLFWCIRDKRYTLFCFKLSHLNQYVYLYIKRKFLLAYLNISFPIKINTQLFCCLARNTWSHFWYWLTQSIPVREKKT